MDALFLIQQLESDIRIHLQSCFWPPAECKLIFSFSVSPCLVLRSHFSLVQLSGPGGNSSVRALRLDQYIKTVLDSVTMS